MHKKFTAFCLPVLGSLVIVGAGFSAWVFNNTLSANANLSGALTIPEVQGAEGFVMKVKDGETVVADSSLSLQTTTLALTLDQGTNLVDGITWTYNAGSEDVSLQGTNELTLEFSFPTSANLYTLLTNNNLSIAWSVTLKFSGKTNFDYVVMNGDTETYDGIISETVTGSYNASGVVGTETVDVGLSYVSDKKPTTIAQYTSMKEALFGDDTSATTDLQTKANAVSLEFSATATWSPKN